MSGQFSFDKVEMVCSMRIPPSLASLIKVDYIKDKVAMEVSHIATLLLLLGMFNQFITTAQ